MGTKSFVFRVVASLAWWASCIYVWVNDTQPGIEHILLTVAYFAMSAAFITKKGDK